MSGKGGITNKLNSTPVIGNAASTAASPSSPTPTPETTAPVSLGSSSKGLNKIPTTTPPTPTPAKANDTVSTASILTMIDQAVEQNSLNMWYQSTYHFRLYTTGDMDATSQVTAQFGGVSSIADFNNKFSSIKQVTVAETGVTGFNIKDVVIHTQSACTDESRTEAVTLITMTVVEANGSTFLDGLYLAANALGVKNYTKCPYYIELTFKGYDANGNYCGTLADPPAAAGTARATFSNGGNWTWAVNITDITVKMNEGGGVYTLNFQITGNEGALAIPGHDIMNVPNPFSITGSTISELFTDYIAKLNQSWKNIAGGNLVVFEAIKTAKIGKFLKGPAYALDKDPGTFVLKSQNPDHEPNRNWKTTSANGPYTVTITKGYKIQDFIVDALKHTEEGQTLAIDNGGVKGAIDQSATAVNSRGFRESIIWATEAVVTQKDFDSISGNYIKHITFYLMPFTSKKPKLSRTQVDQAKTQETQQAIINSYLINGSLRKKYDYIFTGMNTEIIDLDITYNTSYQALIPVYTGTQMRYDAISVPARSRANGTGNETGNAKEDTAAVATVPLTPPTATPTVPAVPVTPTPTPTPAGGSQAKGGRGSGSHANNTIRAPSAAVSARQPAGVAPPQVANAPAASPAPAGSNVSLSTLKGGNTYVEDLLNQMNDPDPTSSGKPISFWQTNATDLESGLDSGLVGQAHRDQLITASVYSQIYNVSKQFNQIKLTIRGDPFWLGQTNIHREINLKFADAALPNNDLPDQTTKHQSFILYFRHPLQIGNDFKPVLKNSKIFTGLYNISTVIHTFADGVFKQELTAVCETSVNPGGWGATDGANGGPSTSSQITRPATVPQQGTFTGKSPVAGVDYTPGDKASFVAAFTPLAIAQSQATGIDPNVIMAQAGLETGWGNSAPQNNFFGIKGAGGSYQTTEVVNGQSQTVMQNFAGYATSADSFNGYGNLMNTPRYASVSQQTTIAGQAQAIQSAGYATDPAYASKITNTANGLNIQMPTKLG